MCTVLIIFLLALDAGSESSGSEHRGGSVQYCSSDRATWRIQTQAGSAEPQFMPVQATPADVEAMAEAQARAEFGIAIQRKLTIVGADDSASLLAALQRQGLRGRVEHDGVRGIAYWRPATR
jgi:hypothetical protein